MTAIAVWPRKKTVSPFKKMRNDQVTTVNSFTGIFTGKMIGPTFRNMMERNKSKHYN